MRATTGSAALALTLAAAGVAIADEYPFSGYFSFEGPGGDIIDERVLCATGFVRQDTDGSFRNYHIDLPAYEADGAIVYLPYTGGRCELHADNIETCTVTFDAVPEEIGQRFVDVIGTIGPETVEITMFESRSDARSWLEIGEPEPLDESPLYRCQGYDDAIVGPHVDTRESTLTLDERYELVSPTSGTVSMATRLAIVERLFTPQ